MSYLWITLCNCYIILDIYKKPNEFRTSNSVKLEKHKIQSCFKCAVEFHYPKNTIELEDIIEEFKMHSKASETVKDKFENENNDNDLNYSNLFMAKIIKKEIDLLLWMTFLV